MNVGTVVTGAGIPEGTYITQIIGAPGGTQFVLSLLDGRVTDPSVIVPLMEAREAYLRAAFAEAQRLFGGLDGYLRDGLGADDALLESLRANLLD